MSWLYAKDECPEFRQDRIGNWWSHFISGGIAGALSRSCTAPLDRLKVYLQVSPKSGVISGFQYLVKEGGILGLWRGNGTNTIKIAPETAMKFLVYEQCKEFIQDNSTHDLKFGERFIAGSIAGAASQAAVYPLEVLKTRLALRKTGEYRSGWDVVRKIQQLEGLRAFYRGFIPNLLGIMPYTGIELAVYETLKKYYLQKDTNIEESELLLPLKCSIISSACGQILTFPLTVVRTRLQAQAVMSHKLTMLGVTRSIIAQKGYRGLYCGLIPCMIQLVPTVGINFLVYERCRQALGGYMT